MFPWLLVIIENNWLAALNLQNSKRIKIFPMFAETKYEYKVRGFERIGKGEEARFLLDGGLEEDTEES